MTAEFFFWELLSRHVQGIGYHTNVQERFLIYLEKSSKEGISVPLLDGYTVVRPVAQYLGSEIQLLPLL